MQSASSGSQVEKKDEGIGISSTSYSAGAAAAGYGSSGSSLVGATSTSATDPYPQVTKEIIKKVCHAAKDKVLLFVKEFDTAFQKMPDERGITDMVALLIQQNNAGKVIFHSQKEEGKSGTDFLIEMHFEDDSELQAELEDISGELGNLSLAGTSMSGALTPGASTSGTGPSSSSDGRNRVTRISTREQTAVSEASSKAKTQLKTTQKQARLQKTAEAERSRKANRVVFLQAKSYHGKERIAGFTYMGKQKTEERPKDMQMNLLKNAVIDAEKKYDSATIVGGYLLYDPDEIVFIPLDDILNKCKEIGCTGNDAEANKVMSLAFREMHSKKKLTNLNHGEQPCFMHDLATAEATKAR
ncbi:hypothetical protein FRB91_005356 [Serendipita sp. 411]|nr:hypothetical protein FRB91_005356 [Serendipita sp. 411]KAG9053349.1 hypothetical protein FS842_008324 [Serendipita sp. 407]